jgi:hypothetical protein
VRSRSAFLLTSTLAASALFLPGAAALAKRLSIHRDYLAHQVIAKRVRSVETVLAFMLNIPWMLPGTHSTDDDTGLFISVSLGIALDLSLNKIITPSSAFDNESLRGIPKADCIDASKALAMDGFDDIDPVSEYGRRLLRRRERAWISLFVLERGVCLARGRSYSVPITPLIELCDRWHTEDIAHRQDGALISMAVLRRDLDGLFRTVRLRCDSYRVIDVGTRVATEIEASIQQFYNNWFTTWTNAIGEGQHHTLPPYVEILVAHTKLSTYSGVINHPTAPLEVKQQFRASVLSSALNVMRACIQGEAKLQSMPNNTAIMISFAAGVALKLSVSSRGKHNRLAPSVRNLIEETAAVLERIGSTPVHRNGASVLYGNYIRELANEASSAPRFNEGGSSTTDSSRALEANFVSTPNTMQQFDYGNNNVAQFWPEPLQLSGMSDVEIVETVLHAGQYDDGLMRDVSMMDTDPNMWADWMNPPYFGLQ